MKSKFLALSFAILMSASLSSCIKNNDSRSIKIDDVLERLNDDYKVENILVTLPKSEYGDGYRFVDYKRQILDFLSNIKYVETKENTTIDRSNQIIYGNGEDHVNIHLYSSLDYIVIEDMRDLSPSFYNYYQIDKEDGLKLKELCYGVYSDYYQFIDKNSKDGGIKDYFLLKKDTTTYFKVDNSSLKQDIYSSVLKEIKKIEYTLIEKPNKELDIILSYDINKSIEWTKFGWTYSLLSDYQTVKLDFIYYKNANKYSETLTKSFYYQIEQKSGEIIYNAAK